MAKKNYKLNKSEEYCRMFRYRRVMKTKPHCKCGKLLVREFVDLGFCSDCLKRLIVKNKNLITNEHRLADRTIKTNMPLVVSFRAISPSTNIASSQPKKKVRRK